eukprot:c5219_g1_i1.p1 GENE.c5219_g1_i1~~c5219_g1_i1.p1  ORF type:complete len:210 (+),score=32.10 c5219_g1_i1:221-850(+)
MALSDPFPVAKEEIQAALGQTRALHQRWLELVQGGDVDELDWTTNELLNGLQNLDWDFEDMMKTIEAVERDKTYKIDTAEISSRRKFVNDARSQVSRIRNEVQDPKWKQRQDHKDSRDALMAVSSSSPANNKESYAKLQAERRNQGFIDGQMSQQQQIIREQDDDLTALGSTVSRLGQMGSAINQELNSQKRCRSKNVLLGFGEGLFSF